MATEYIKLSGIVYWAQLVQPDTKYGVKWRTRLYPDEKSMETFKESGLQLQVKEDEVGEYITLRRDKEKLIKGKVTVFDPPKVFVEGKLYDGLVGNGSEAVCDLAVYDTMKGKGHRLETVNVTNLVEYVPDEEKEGPDVDLS